MPSLPDVINRIASSDALQSGVEEATRQGAIMPVLAALGWDCFDVTEVVPEFQLGSRRVDYSLRVAGASHVFIEVKRGGTPLDPHQEQLLEYAFFEGVPLAALTDGFVWWLYLPTRAGSWEQRKFFTLDVRRVAPEAAAELLHRFLNRTDVLAGIAQTAAEEELLSQARNVRIEQALPEAWRQLLTEPDDLLMDLLTEAVAGLAGASPDAVRVAEFLLARAGAGIPTAGPTKPSVPATTSSVVAPQIQPVSRAAFTGRTPISYVLDSTRTEVRTWREVLVGVASRLMVDYPDAFEAAALSLHGSKRNYCAREPESLKYPLPLPNGFFVEGNLSANDIMRVARALIATVRDEHVHFDVATT